MIEEMFSSYDRKNIALPGSDKMLGPNQDKYDIHIAVWADYFTKKLHLKSPIDPDMVKALIASESSFKPSAVNRKATGLTQVTTDTLNVLQDLSGEAKDFVFREIRKKDLANPNVSIALGVRWLAYKQVYAERVLKRPVSSDEVIQLYKGILNDKSHRADQIMKKYRNIYEILKK